MPIDPVSPKTNGRSSLAAISALPAAAMLTFVLVTPIVPASDRQPRIEAPSLSARLDGGALARAAAGARRGEGLLTLLSLLARANALSRRRIIHHQWCMPALMTKRAPART